jgi:hypothetical protein
MKRCHGGATPRQRNVVLFLDVDGTLLDFRLDLASVRVDAALRWAAQRNCEPLDERSRSSALGRSSHSTAAWGGMVAQRQEFTD